MAKFKVAVSWEMYAEVEVEAESLEDAIEVAQTGPLPEESYSSYIDGSFKVDEEATQGLNKEKTE